VNSSTRELFGSDDALGRALRQLDKRVTPRPEFAEALFAIVQHERHVRPAPRFTLLAAAALLTIALAGAALFGSGAIRLNTVLPVVSPPPSAPAASPTALASPAPTDVASLTVGALPSFVAETVLSDRRLVAIEPGHGGIWVLRGSIDDDPTRNPISNDDVADAELLHIRSSDGVISRMPLADWSREEPYSVNGLAVGDSVYVLAYHYRYEGDPSLQAIRDRHWELYSVAGPGEPLARDVIAFDGVFSSFALAPDPDDGAWIVREDGVTHLGSTRDVLAEIDNPWTTDNSSLWYSRLEPGMAFGSLWAHEAKMPAVHRIDPQTGEVIATIELSDCEPETTTHYGIHAAMLYPITNVRGMDDAMVASCPMDNASHAYLGPVHLIDPATNKVVDTIDLGLRYGAGVVFDGRWFVGRGPEGDMTLVEPDRGVFAIDAATGESLEIYDTTLRVVDLAATDDALWAVLAGSEDHNSTQLIRLAPDEP
jgi:hypothetical protein